MRERLAALATERPVLLLAAAFVFLSLLAGSAIYLVEILGGHPLSFLDAVFTGVSGSTVTGLTTVPTHTLQLPSQIVILVSIQLGGLLAIIGAAVILRIVGLRGRPAASLIAQVPWQDVLSIGRTVIIFSLLVEGAAAAAFFGIFLQDMPWPQALWFAVFHAVSAYYNAGFFLFSNNLYGFSGNPLVLGIIMAEIILGGLGFLVILDMKLKFFAVFRRQSLPRFYLHSRLVLLGTAGLILFGFFAFWAMEWNGVLSGKPAGEAALISLFESVSARTAGFSAVELGGISSATALVLMLLMFIGAGPASISGGVKVTTIMLVFFTFLAFLRGKERVVIGGTEVSRDNIWRATGVLVLYGVALFIFSSTLLMLEPFSMRDVLFEAFSASGTVGFSTGITPLLSVGGKIIVMLMMLLGRVGPLALTYLLAGRIMESKNPYYEQQEVGIG